MQSGNSRRLRERHTPEETQRPGGGEPVAPLRGISTDVVKSNQKIL